MATYKDDLDILKAAEKDANKLSLNAITELDNKGQLGMYGGGSEIKTGTVRIVNNGSASVQIRCAAFDGGVSYARVNTLLGGDEISLNGVIFPGVIILNTGNSIFQETSSSTCVVTEEMTLHIIDNGGGDA